MAGMFEKPRPWWHASRLLRVGLGLLFIFSGVLKLVDLPSFLHDVLAYNVLAGPAAGWLAVLLPVLEVLLGLLLVTGWLRAGALAALIGILGVFIFVHAYAIQRGLDVECGCFGAIPVSSYVMLLINVVLIITAGWVLSDAIKSGVVEKPKYKLSPHLFRKAK